MKLKTCTELVASNSSFYPSPGSDETYPYRQCEKIFPKWHIQEGLSKDER